jgi:hypothetical protein
MARSGHLEDNVCAVQMNGCEQGSLTKSLSTSDHAADECSF